tara:strand:+ start:6 stop:1016 length:1011 start_codon:yes stop_codon:yes gene_type:complete
MRTTLAILTALLAATSLVAQNSSASTLINEFGLGCQGLGGRLTGGVVINSTVGMAYNAATGVLQVSVNNNTPIVAGESTATISEVHINFPNGAVTGATLNSQAGSGGATPAFTMSFDADSAAAPNPNAAGCLGDFNLTLSAGANGAGGIANPAATSIATANPVFGPVTFELQLTGPGTTGVDAEAIIATISQGSPSATSVALKWDGGGVQGQENGYVGSCDQCRTSIYTTGQTSIGSTFNLCATGGFGCHACIWISATPGPTIVQGVTIPVGFPIAAAWTLGNFGIGGTGNSQCISISVPNNSQLQGFEFYTANVTFNALNVQGYGFSPQFTVRIN